MSNIQLSTMKKGAITLLRSIHSRIGGYTDVVTRKLVVNH